MDSIPLAVLVIILLVCLACSAFFSASETGMIGLNRYKLKHQADEGDEDAKRVMRLLNAPDRLLGTILLGNNFVNITATSVATIIGIRLLGDLGVLVSTVVLTLVVLIFGEVAPKTLAAVNPNRIAFPASRILQPLIVLLYPLVFVINRFCLLFLRPLGVKSISRGDERITNEELKSIVSSSVHDSISPERQDMLMSVLELEDITVDEVMVSRRDIEGVDLEDSWEEILKQILASRHGRLVVYRDHIDKVVGMLHLRDILPLIYTGALNKPSLIESLRPCVFVPEGALLRVQLLEFRAKRVRSGLVVDEYGDIQGLITLEDIVAHIMGDLVSEDDEEESPEIVPRSERVFVVEGMATLRQINRELGLKLPLDGPNTLNGLIVETLGNFPEPGTVLSFHECSVRVLSFANGVVGSAEITLQPAQHSPNL